MYGLLYDLPNHVDTASCSPYFWIPLQTASEDCIDWQLVSQHNRVSARTDLWTRFWQYY